MYRVGGGCAPAGTPTGARTAVQASRNREGGFMASSTPLSVEDLERELERLSEQEFFDPPEDFVQKALITDDSIYEEAEKDWKGWWIKKAKELTWFQEPSERVDDSNPPYYEWFSD